jgi:hypothetical protein
MSTSAPRRKSLIYKQAVFNKPLDGETLASLLKAALKSHPYPFKRQHNPSGDGVSFSFVNYNGTHGRGGAKGNLLGGEFFSYTQGADQSTLDVDPNATELNVGSLSPSQNKEFLEGAVYFGVMDNHVVAMQSSALRILDLEKHLNWLLATLTGLMDSECYVALTDHVPVQNKAAFSDAKGLTLSSSLQFQPVTRDGKAIAKNKDGETSAKSMFLKPTGQAWEAIKAFLGESFDLPTELKAAEVLNSHRLQVQLFLKWERTPSEDTTDFLTNIAYKLRNVGDEIDYSVETRTGTISKEEFKLTQSFQVQWNNGRPQFDVLFPKMLDWLDGLVKSGKLKM